MPFLYRYRYWYAFFFLFCLADVGQFCSICDTCWSDQCLQRYCHSCLKVMIQFQHATVENTHYFAGSYHWEMAMELLINILESYMMPHFTAYELLYAFISHNCDFDNHAWCSNCLIRSKVINMQLFCDLWPF